MMKMKLGLIAMLMATILSSCGCSKKLEASSTTIQGEWTIETAMNKSTEGGEKQAFINFNSDGKMNGNATVNSFFGGYTLKGNEISFTQVGMTRMMGASMDIETAITQAIGEANTIEIKGDDATIADKAGNTVMVLKRKK